jgi:hypothetical protein
VAQEAFRVPEEVPQVLEVRVSSEVVEALFLVEHVRGNDLEVRFLGCRVVHPEDDLAEVVTSSIF